MAGIDFTGPAAALSSATDAVSGAVSGAVESVGSFLSKLSGGKTSKFPLPNPLFNYATYDYVLGIAVLTDKQLAEPDKTYMRNMKLPLICKSANADPGNRIKTAFGSFDFFIDNLEIESSIGLEKSSNTNMLKMSFTITEPYSMGMFLMALQKAAWDAGHDNYLMAPFLLTIDFRGNTESGQMVNIPGTSRKIPFNFIESDMTVTERGAVYQFTARPTNSPAHAAQNSQLKTDVSIKGATVQEVLQTGEKSLQTVINKRLQQLKDDKIVPYPDEVLILFPDKTASAPEAGANNASETKSTATTAKAAGSVGVDDISKQLKVTRSTTNKTLVQADAACNALGKASLGFDETRKGDAPFGKDADVYDPKTGVMVRGNNRPNPKVNDYRFSQNSDIINAINQVLLTSDYAKKTLGETNVGPDGMRKWWRIDTKVYNITTKENYKSTGTKPKLIVYEVVPYEVHTSKVTPPNTKAPGFDVLKKQAVKHYNYTYTGKNVDILNFNINFKIGFAAVMANAKLSRTQDVKRTGPASGTESETVANNQPMPEGNEPSKNPAVPTQVRYTETINKTDNKGGGGLEDGASRAARMFHSAITSGADMLKLDMKIIGDPYYIAQSGTGNYRSKEVSKNLNADGSVNYQNGEVDILINFKTPIDINQSTGLYDFGKASKMSDVVQWSGLYQVMQVTSSFKDGQFTQVLTGNRRANQELKETATAANMYNSSKQADKSVPVSEDKEK